MPVHFVTTDAGTTANKLVQLDGSAKLPAVDGSALTNITAGVTTGQLAGGTLPASFTTLAASGAVTGLTYNGLTITTTTSTLTLAGNLVTTGAFNTTFAQSATTTITLPATSATMARTDAAQTFTGVQTFSGSIDVPTLTSSASITGGASNMTVTSGTGASRTLIFKTTTSGSAATTALTLNADQSASFVGGVSSAVSSGTQFGDGSGGIAARNSSTDFYASGVRVGRWRGTGLSICASSGGIPFVSFCGGTDPAGGGDVVGLCNTASGVITVTAGGSSGFGKLRMGVSTQGVNLGGAIFDDFTSTSTTHTDGTEDDLFTHTLVASTLGTNGDKVEQVEHVSFVSSATAARRIKKYFGGTLIFDSTALTLSLGGEFDLSTTVIRVSSTVVSVAVSVTSTSASSIPYSTFTSVTGLTLSNTQILKTTGIASGTGAASGDVINRLSSMVWLPAAS